MKLERKEERAGGWVQAERAFPEHMRFYCRFGKRGFDLGLAIIGLAFLLIPLLAIAAWLRLVEGGPVLFCHERIGRHGSRFQIYKFRTMQDGAAAEGSVTVAGDRHITRTGRWLRRLKLDELPQLLNVLKGEMSFVGPRPDVPGYMDRLQGPAARLLELRPGITGPASLAFRDEEKLLATVADPKRFNDTVIFPEKVRLNLQYQEEVSFKKDLLYLWQTVLPSRCKLPTGQWTSTSSNVEDSRFLTGGLSKPDNSAPISRE